MGEIFVNTKQCSIDCLKEKDLWSVEELLNKLADLESDNHSLQEEFDDYKQNITDNYEPVSPYKMYGVSESDFH